jgi:hypothetical protein
MPDKPRRRFPFLALLAVVVLAAGVVVAPYGVQLLPRTQEWWVDANTATVEVRYYLCGVCCSTKRPGQFNFLSRRYLELAAPELDDPEWVNVGRFRSWLRPSHPGPPIGSDDLLGNIYRIGEIVKDKGFRQGLSFKLDTGTRDAPKVDPEACDALVLAFMDLVHLGPERDFFRGYYFATLCRFAEVDGEVTAQDVIPVDTWLADPTCEHYFGPTRIY